MAQFILGNHRETLLKKHWKEDNNNSWFYLQSLSRSTLRFCEYFLYWKKISGWIHKIAEIVLLLSALFLREKCVLIVNFLGKCNIQAKMEMEKLNYLANKSLKKVLSTLNKFIKYILTNKFINYWFHIL